MTPTDIMIHIVGPTLLSLFAVLALIDGFRKKNDWNARAEGIAIGRNQMTSEMQALQERAISQGYAKWQVNDSRSGTTDFVWVTPELPTPATSTTSPAPDIAEAARAMHNSLVEIRALIVKATMTGFDCRSGDWAQHLFNSQWDSFHAVQAYEKTINPRG